MIASLRRSSIANVCGLQRGCARFEKEQHSALAGCVALSSSGALPWRPHKSYSHHTTFNSCSLITPAAAFSRL